MFSMISTMYQVTITNTLSNSGVSAGFIDATKVEQYMANGSAATSLTNAENKKRGNIRFLNVLENLQMMANMWVSNAVANGANANTEGTTFTMNLEIERGDDYLLTRDEVANDGSELSGANAIVRCIARGLMEARTGWRVEVVDPTTTTGMDLWTDATKIYGANAIVRVPTRVLDLDVGALANSLTTASAAITVTKITP